MIWRTTNYQESVNVLATFTSVPPLVWLKGGFDVWLVIGRIRRVENWVQAGTSCVALREVKSNVPTFVDCIFPPLVTDVCFVICTILKWHFHFSYRLRGVVENLYRIQGPYITWMKEIFSVILR